MRKKFIRIRLRRNEKEGKDGRKSVEFIEIGSIIVKDIDKV